MKYKIIMITAIFLLMIVNVTSLSTTNQFEYLNFDSTTLSGMINNVTDLAKVGQADYTAIGKINGSYTFDGRGDAIKLGNDTRWKSSGSLTYDFWFNTRDFSPVTAGDSAFDGTMFFGFYPYVRIGFKPGTRQLEMDFKDTTTWHYNNYAVTLNTSQWYHFAYVHDATNNKDKFYLDGKNVKNDTGTFVSGLAVYTGDLGYRTSIGARFGGGTVTNEFNGTIDEFSAMDRALSDSEILEKYNNGNGLQYPYSSPSNIIINTSTFNLTDEACTIWSNNLNTNCNTTNGRPTITFTTTDTATCSASLNNQTLYNASNACTGTTSISCKLNTNNVLVYGTQLIYFQCQGGSGTTGNNVTSYGSVNMTAGGGGGTSCIINLGNAYFRPNTCTTFP